MTNAAAKVEVATSNGLEGDSFTSKNVFDHDIGDRGQMKCCPVPSSFMMPMQLQSLKLLRITA